MKNLVHYGTKKERKGKPPSVELLVKGGEEGKIYSLFREEGGGVSAFLRGGRALLPLFYEKGEKGGDSCRNFGR